jgi:hypothetical protein
MGTKALAGGKNCGFCDMCERVYRRLCVPTAKKIGY